MSSLREAIKTNPSCLFESCLISRWTPRLLGAWPSPPVLHTCFLRMAPAEDVVVALEAGSASGLQRGQRELVGWGGAVFCFGSRRRERRTVPVDGDMVVPGAADRDVATRSGADGNKETRKGPRLMGCCFLTPPPARLPGRRKVSSRPLEVLERVPYVTWIVSLYKFVRVALFLLSSIFLLPDHSISMAPWTAPAAAGAPTTNSSR